MPITDMEIMRRAYEHENDTRRPSYARSWEYYAVGASRRDIQHLIDEGLVTKSYQDSTVKKFKLTEEGRKLVKADSMEQEIAHVPATSVLDAMSLVVGFDDVKETIANAIDSQRRIHFLLEGPPACAKSLMLEAVRSSVPGAYMCFGSRTSAAGLSDVLFEKKPTILLMDEADKMRADCFSVLLGLMESGEILETKSQKTRGIQLKIMVIAACNSSAKFPPEFLSRFALHIQFPKYTREEFIDVCRGFLSRAESCPPEVAATIGSLVHDYGLGDVRKARGVWQLMTSSKEAEMRRVIQMMLKYSPDGHKKIKAIQGGRMPGL